MNLIKQQKEKLKRVLQERDKWCEKRDKLWDKHNELDKIIDPFAYQRIIEEDKLKLLKIKHTPEEYLKAEENRLKKEIESCEKELKKK